MGFDRINKRVKETIYFITIVSDTHKYKKKRKILISQPDDAYVFINLPKEWASF